MKSNNVIQDKSLAFAIRIANTYKYFVSEKKEFVLSKQLLRSGTSIGANVEEAIGGLSEKDFLSRVGIACKEAGETVYWLKLLNATGHLSNKEFVSLFNDAEELCKILGKIQTTVKSKYRNSQFLIRN